MEQVITTMIQVPMFLSFLIFAFIVIGMLVAIGTVMLSIPILAVGEGVKPVIRWFSREKGEKEQVPVMAAVRPAVTVEGFSMPRNLHYHRNHLWAKRDNEGQVRIGFDDFARKLLGNIHRIDMLTFNIKKLGEKETRTIIQGWDVYSNGKSARILAPIQGRVKRINEELGHKTATIAEDPYGEGWLCTIVPEETTDLWADTITDDEVEVWMKDEVKRLRLYASQHVGTTLMDGGELVEDLVEKLTENEWHQLLETFMSTRGQ